jgi:hypothetical protein
MRKKEKARGEGEGLTRGASLHLLCPDDSLENAGLLGIDALYRRSRPDVKYSVAFLCLLDSCLKFL